MKIEITGATVEMSDIMLHRARRAYDEELMTGAEMHGKQAEFSRTTIWAARDAMILGLILKVETKVKDETLEIKPDLEWLGMLGEDDHAKLSDHAKGLLKASQARSKK